MAVGFLSQQIIKFMKMKLNFSKGRDFFLIFKGIGVIQ